MFWQLTTVKLAYNQCGTAPEESCYTWDERILCDDLRLNFPKLQAEAELGLEALLVLSISVEHQVIPPVNI